MPESVSVPEPVFASAPGPGGEQPQGVVSAMTPLTSVERPLPPTVSLLPLPI